MSTMSDYNDHDPIENAEEIIERFGGIRPMARKMAVAVTTVQGWKKRNVIPGSRRDELVRAASTHNIDLSDVSAANSDAANENSFAVEVAEADKREPEAPARKADDLSAAPSPRASMAADDGAKARHDRNEEMMAEMHKAQSLTFTKSVLFLCNSYFSRFPLIKREPRVVFICHLNCHLARGQ